MKKVLIVIDNLAMGGIATALYNYINILSQYVDCDLLVFNSESIDLDRIPPNIKLISSTKKISILGYYQQELKEKSIGRYIIRALFVLLARTFGGEMARSLLFLGSKKIGDYDLAISYAQDDLGKSLTKGCNDYVLKKVNAKYKAAYIHCDYESFGGYNTKQLSTYSKFDFIINVSESCKKSFIKMFPSLETKCIVGENFINVENVLQKSVIDEKYYKNFTFISACRLSYEKGLLRTVKVIAKLKQEGLTNFQWIILGDGICRKEMEEMITQYDLEKIIKLLGEKKNPYKYIKNASAFLLPSYNEAAPMVFEECHVLHVPVISTNTCSAIELVQKQSLGVVCENSEQGIYKVLKDIIIGKIVLTDLCSYGSDINERATQQLMSVFSLLK